METAASLPFAAWESFYVIVGSSGAALTGLVFVVVTLGAEMNIASGAAMRAYGTPTVVHFCAVLFVSAVLSAPWPNVRGAAVVLGGCGIAGIIYVGVVTVRSVRQTQYRPVLEDWIWHSVLPAIAYGLLLWAAVILLRHPTRALFAVASSSLLLLFIGIHNAWDSVIYIAFTRRDASGTQE